MAHASTSARSLRADVVEVILFGAGCCGASSGAAVRRGDHRTKTVGRPREPFNLSAVAATRQIPARAGEAVCERMGHRVRRIWVALLAC